MASVGNKAGRGNMWFLMEPKCPSMILSPEKVSTSLNSFYLFYYFSR